jgi:hypothetical protein
MRLTPEKHLEFASAYDEKAADPNVSQAERERAVVMAQRFRMLAGRAKIKAAEKAAPASLALD